MLVYLLFVLVVIAIFLIVGSSALASLSAAPWVPMWKNDVKRILDLAQIKPDEKVYDLGCGDGRILVEAAEKYDAQVVGIEIALLPYLISQIRTLFAGVWSRSQVKLGNLYHKNVSEADVIICFLSAKAMKKLSHKLDKELKSGGRVVSYAFPILDWQPKIIDKPNEQAVAIYLYQK
ncbi:MAG: class I SAM-dependent methyltransferase [Patescibacteria group bacterium]|nr:class I SAM-dependent methyltransferase [Patescibacteria group bacterium]